MMFFRSLLFSIGSIISAILIGTFGFLLFPFPFRFRARFIANWAHFNLWFLKTTCNISFQVTGLENIPENNAIVLCKHQSAWETLALQKFFFPQTWVLKKEIMWMPFFGWGMAALEPIAIDRSAGRKAVDQIINQGKKRLDDGRWVIIFPEGTRIVPGKKKRFGIGGAVLAEATGYPVLPVAHNAGEFWPRRTFIKRPGIVQIHIGPLIETKNKSTQEINAEAETWINNTMQLITSQKFKSNDND